MVTSIEDILRRAAPVLPVLVVDRIEDAQPLAEALLAGGIRVVEVTLRTPVALDVIRVMKDIPGLTVGAGTVVKPQQIHRVADAGADFAVSPGLASDIMLAASEWSLPLLPGIATPTDAMHALNFDLRCCKFFPAEAAGGVNMLKALSGPFPDFTFCPTGGINLANAPAYLALPQVLCVGGSWLVPADLLAARDWAGITALARKAIQLN